LLKDNKGLHHIARLLASPGTEHSAQALALEVEGEMEAPPGVGQGRHETGESIASSLGDAGPALDARAKAEYRRRLKELNDDLEEAERNNDLGRAERIRMELEFVAQQVSSAVGLAGRDRPTGSHAERARLLVTQRIKASLKRITESHPALGDHLSQSLKTGQRCVYQPGDVPIDWQT
jgi:non-specific serine/threonine protein kinase